MTEPQHASELPGERRGLVDRALAQLFDSVTAPQPAPFAERSRKETLSALRAWFESGTTEHALVCGPAGRGKSTVLARFFQSMVGEHAARALFVPVARRFGTALERPALTLLYARLEALLGPCRRPGERPLGVRSMRTDLACMLSDDHIGDRALLLILDGLDETVGWQPTFLSQLGSRVRCVIAGERPTFGEELGWAPGSTTIIPLNSPTIDDVSSALPSEARETSEAGEGADALARELLRLSAGEPLVLDGYWDALFSSERAPWLDESDLPGLVAGLEAWMELVMIRSGDAAAARWLLTQLALAESRLARDDLAEIAAMVGRSIDWSVLQRLSPVLADEDGYALRHAAYGRYLLRAHDASEPSALMRYSTQAPGDAPVPAVPVVPAAPVAPAAPSRFVLEFRALNRTRFGAPLDDLASLVAPAWLAQWRTQPDAAAGFAADVERVFEQACEDLQAQAPHEARAPHGGVAMAHCLLVMARCLLVKSSLWGLVQAVERELATSAEEHAGDDAEPADCVRYWPPVGEVPLEFERTLGDAQEQTLALLAFAEQLDESARGPVLEWALAAARRDESGLALAAVAPFVRPADRSEVAREALRAFEQDGGLLDHDGSVLEQSGDVDAQLSLCSLAALLPEPAIAEAARSVFHALTAEGELHALERFLARGPVLPPPLLTLLWTWASQLPPGDKAFALALLAGHHPEPSRDAAVQQAFSLLLEAEREGSLSTVRALQGLAPLAPALPHELLGEATSLAVRAGLQRDLQGDARLEALAALLPLVSDAERSSYWQQISDLLRSTRATHRLPKLLPWLLAAGADPVLDLVRELGSDLPALIAFAKLVPERRVELTAELIERTRNFSDESADWLFALTPLAQAMPESDARWLCARLGRYLLDIAPRAELLRTWTHVDLAELAPLFHRIGGPQAVIGVAREIVQVAEWFP